MRQEFGAEPRYQYADDDQKPGADRDHDLAMRQRPTKNWRVNPPQHAHGDGFSLSHVLGKQVRCEHRRDRERRDQRSDQRVAVGPRHRSEDLALDALHREQRDECRHRDGGGEKDRLIDLQRTGEDQAQAVRPGARAIRRSGRVGAEAPLRELLQELLALLGSRLEIPKYVLDQNHGGIDNDPEVNRTDGQEIRVFTQQDQDDNTEEQREWNVGAYNDGAAQVT